MAWPSEESFDEPQRVRRGRTRVVILDGVKISPLRMPFALSLVGAYGREVERQSW